MKTIPELAEQAVAHIHAHPDELPVAPLWRYYHLVKDQQHVENLRQLQEKYTLQDGRIEIDSASYTVTNCGLIKGTGWMVIMPTNAYLRFAWLRNLQGQSDTSERRSLQQHLWRLWWILNKERLHAEYHRN